MIHFNSNIPFFSLCSFLQFSGKSRTVETGLSNWKRQLSKISRKATHTIFQTQLCNNLLGNIWFWHVWGSYQTWPDTKISTVVISILVRLIGEWQWKVNRMNLCSATQHLSIQWPSCVKTCNLCLTRACLVNQSQSNAAILTTKCWEPPATGYTQHIQPQNTAWTEEKWGSNIDKIPQHCDLYISICNEVVADHAFWIKM